MVGQYKNPKAVEKVADPWKLEFKHTFHTDLPQQEEGRRRRQHTSSVDFTNGSWHLSNSVLTGELEDSGEMQFDHRPPLGRSDKLNWDWQWVEPPSTPMSRARTRLHAVSQLGANAGEQAHTAASEAKEGMSPRATMSRAMPGFKAGQICPLTSIPVSIVEFLEYSAFVATFTSRFGTVFSTFFTFLDGLQLNPTGSLERWRCCIWEVGRTPGHVRRRPMHRR